MDRLSAIAAFRAVVDHGGYAAAARAVGRSKTALSKAVADLEAQLGVRLLQRSTRRMALTDPGRQFHARCVQLLADLEEAEAEATPKPTEVDTSHKILTTRAAEEVGIWTTRNVDYDEVEFTGARK